MSLEKFNQGSNNGETNNRRRFIKNFGLTALGIATPGVIKAVAEKFDVGIEDEIKKEKEKLIRALILKYRYWGNPTDADGMAEYINKETDIEKAYKSYGFDRQTIDQVLARLEKEKEEIMSHVVKIDIKGKSQIDYTFHRSQIILTEGIKPLDDTKEKDELIKYFSLPSTKNKLVNMEKVILSYMGEKINERKILDKVEEDINRYIENIKNIRGFLIKESDVRSLVEAGFEDNFAGIAFGNEYLLKGLHYDSSEAIHEMKHAIGGIDEKARVVLSIIIKTRPKNEYKRKRLFDEPEISPTISQVWHDLGLDFIDKITPEMIDQILNENETRGGVVVSNISKIHLPERNWLKF